MSEDLHDRSNKISVRNKMKMTESKTYSASTKSLNNQAKNFQLRCRHGQSLEAAAICVSIEF